MKNSHTSQGTMSVLMGWVLSTCSALAADQSDADQAATERPPEAPEPSTFTEVK